MTSKYSAKDFDINIKEYLKDSPVEPTKQEYAKLKERDKAIHVLTFSAKTSKQTENKELNRYSNIFPYDYNRIKLKTPINDCDYINGSYINSPVVKIEGKNEVLDLFKYDKINFIATQGPLPHTCEHHWQAIYDNNVDVIVMLTRLKEGTEEGQGVKEKCEKYWPSKDDQCQFRQFNRFGRFEIMIVDEIEVRPNLIKSVLYLIDCDSRNIHDEKVITHLQYTGWPDFGAPETTGGIINIVRDVREIIQNDKNRQEHFTILTHCSAGVGRTGTFIALYKLMEEIDDKMELQMQQKESKKRQNTENVLNIFQTVLTLRNKRVEMVQSFAQYTFLYACVSDYLREVDRLHAMVDDYLSMSF